MTDNLIGGSTKLYFCYKDVINNYSPELVVTHIKQPPAFRGYICAVP